MSQSTDQSQPAKPVRDKHWTILDLCAWGLLALTLGASCGGWHWAMDLMSHFRCYYAGFAVLILVGLWHRSSWSRWSVVIVLIYNLGLIVPYYLPVTQTASTSTATTFSIISLNVLTSNPDKGSVVSYLRDRQPDLILVMEVNADWGLALKELDDLYPHRLFQFRPDNFGIGLMSKWPLTEPRIVDFGDLELPSIVAPIERDGQQFVLVGTHPLPPVGARGTSERNTQLAAVARYVRDSKKRCVVAGDFNATPWSVAFREFDTESGLRDSARGLGIQNSWNAKSWLMRIPIDHVFVPQDAIVIRRAIGPDVGSDHFPVEATIALPN